MRKTRLVILPGVRSLKTIGCLLLFLACPTIAFKGQENREVEPLRNAQNFKEFWIQESPWPEGPGGTGKRTDDLGSGLWHDTARTKNTRSTESPNRRKIGDQRADSRRASPAPRITRNLLVERREVRRQSKSESRQRAVDVRENFDTRRERTQVADKIRSSDEMRRTYENSISRNSIETRTANTREPDVRAEKYDGSRIRIDSNRLSLIDRRSISRDATYSARETRFLNIRDSRENQRNVIGNRALSTDRNEETRRRNLSPMASSLPERITRSKRQVAREDNMMNRFERRAESVTHTSRVVVREPTTTDSRRQNIVERENTRTGRRDQVRRVDRNGRIEEERRNNMRVTEQVRVNINDMRRDGSLDRRARANVILNSNMNTEERNDKTLSGERGVINARNTVNSGSNLNRRQSRVERTVEREVRLADQSRFDTRKSLNDDVLQRLSINRDSRASIDKTIRSNGIRVQAALNDREVRLADFNRRAESIRNLKRTTSRREVRSDDDRSAYIRTTRDDTADIQRNRVRNLVRKVGSTNEREIGQLEKRRNADSLEGRRFEIRANNRQPTSTEGYRRNDETRSATLNKQSDRTSQLHERQLPIRNERNRRDARVMERRLSETDNIPITGADIRRALSDNRIPTFVQSHATGIRSVEDRRRSDSVPELLYGRTFERSDGVSFRNVRRLERSSSKSNMQLRDQIRANPYLSYSTKRKFRVQPPVRSIVRDIQSDGTIQIIDRRLSERDHNNVREARTSERRTTVTLKPTEETRGDMRRVQVADREFRLQSSKHQIARDIRSDKTRQLLDRTVPETTHKLLDEIVADSRRVRNDRSTRNSSPDKSLARDIRIAEANSHSRRSSRFDNRITRLNENIIRETRILGREVFEANIAGPRNVRADIEDSRLPTRIQSFARDTRSLKVRRRSDRTSQFDDRRNRNILREARVLDRSALDRERLGETRTEHRRVSLSPTAIRSQERDIRAVEASRRQDRTFRILERQSREGSGFERIARRNERDNREDIRTDTRDSQNPMTVRARAGRSVEIRRASQFVGRQLDRRDGNTFRETRSLERSASGTELKPSDEIRVDFRRVVSDSQDSQNSRSVRSRTNIRSVEDSIQLDRISRRVGRELERGTGNMVRENRNLDRTVSETRLKPNNVVRLRINVRDSQNPTSSRTLTRSIRSVEAGRRLDRTSRLVETQLDTRSRVFREINGLGMTDSATQLKPSNEIGADRRIRTGIREFRTTSIRSNGKYIRSAETSRRIDGVSRLDNGQFEGRKDNTFGSKTESGTYNLPVDEAVAETRAFPTNIRDSRFSTFRRSFARDALPVEINRRSVRRTSIPLQSDRHLERTFKSGRIPTDETRTDTNRQSNRSSRRIEIDGKVRRVSNRQDDKIRQTSFISAGVFEREMNFVKKQTNAKRVNDGARHQDRTEILFAKRVADGRMERIGAKTLVDRTSRLVNRQADTEMRKDSRFNRQREMNHSDMKINKRTFRVATVERYTDYSKIHKPNEEFELPQKASYFETTKMAVMNLISTLDFTNTDYKGVGATVLYGGIMCYSLLTNVNKKVIF